MFQKISHWSKRCWNRNKCLKVQPVFVLHCSKVLLQMIKLFLYYFTLCEKIPCVPISPELYYLPFDIWHLWGDCRIIYYKQSSFFKQSLLLFICLRQSYWGLLFCDLLPKLSSCHLSDCQASQLTSSIPPSKSVWMCVSKSMGKEKVRLQNCILFPSS